MNTAYGGDVTFQVDDTGSSEGRAVAGFMLTLALLTWVLGCGSRGLLEKRMGLSSTCPREVTAHNVRAKEFLPQVPPFHLWLTSESASLQAALAEPTLSISPR